MNDQCKTGIFYFRNNLQRCLSFPPNCSNFDYFNKTCLQCSTLTYLNRPTCQTTPFCTNVNFAYASLPCSSCLPGFYLSSSSFCMPLPPFCISFTTQCQLCISPFNLSNGICLDANCIAANLATGVCQNCQNGYLIGRMGVCIYYDVNCI